MIYYRYIQSRNPEKLFMILLLIVTVVKFSAPALSYGHQFPKRKRWRHDPCHDWIVVTIKGFIVSFVTTLTWWFHFLSLFLSLFFYTYLQTVPFDYCSKGSRINLHKYVYRMIFSHYVSYNWIKSLEMKRFFVFDSWNWQDSFLFDKSDSFLSII